MASYHQGKFVPRNPKKYKGDVNNIVFRSSWERKCMKYFDEHPEIIAWSSEELVVPYLCETDNRMHRYFPDFLIKKKNGDIFMIEVKPLAQTAPPKKQGKKKERYIQEALTWGKNQSKWKAAEAYCKKMGWKFQIITEKELKI